MNINFDKVKKFQSFINQVFDEPRNLDENEKELSYNLIQEELYEYKNAKTKKEHLDALCDLLYLIIGRVYQHGFESIFEEAFDIVCESNLSKFFKEEDIEETLKNYADKTVVLRRVNDEYFSIHNEDGKVIKPSTYFNPDFSKFNLDEE